MADQNKSKDFKPLIEDVVNDYRNTGATTITERRVEIGTDGKRRTMVRQRLVQNGGNDDKR